jgi:predicted dehydrogenase
MPLLAADSRVALAGVCRLGASELAAVRDRFDFPFASESFDELLERCPMDALVISTPHALHAAQAEAAAARGLHILIEKPVSLSAADGARVNGAAEAAGVVALVPFGWNFKPFMSEARRWLADGLLGEVLHVAARMASPIGELLEGRDLPGTEGLDFRPDPAMWANPATGGYGWGQLVHLLGALFWLCPGLEPHTIRGMTRRPGGGADLFDAALVECASGATIALSGSATLPIGTPFDLSLEIYGSDGALSVQMSPARVELRRHDGANRTLALAPDAGLYECIEPVRRFVDLCLGLPVENAGSLATALPGVAVIEAMHLSAAAGRDITLPPKAERSTE